MSNKPDFNNMTVARLRELAKASGIDLGNLSRKQDIIDKIETTIQEDEQRRAPATPPTATHDTPEGTVATDNKPTIPDAPTGENNAPTDDTEMKEGTNTGEPATDTTQTAEEQTADTKAATTPPTATHDTPEGTAATDNKPTMPDAPTGENNVSTDDAEKESTPEAAAFLIDRVLKVTKPLIKGDDVKAIQTVLIEKGFHCGVDGASGVYNAGTAQAVRHFQSMNRLIVSGKVEKFTAQALGAEWKE